MKINKENLIAGLIAVVALAAIICEVIFGGVSTVSVAAAIKDMTGIIVDVIVFVVAFKVFIKREDVGFRGQLEKAMEEIENSYAPLIKEHKAKDTNEKDVLKNQEYIRYDLAKKVNSLFGEECNDYMRFFELKSESPEDIKFFVRKKFFGEPFEPERIASHIKGFCERKYGQYKVTYALDKDGANITISFGKVMETAEDINSITAIVDDVLFLFIAEYKNQ
ncbi:MAG: hypothetical protein IKT46_03225 [Clostridia bacterium]|nr:hypothetical protein [Clostridia bacterium]